MLYRLMIFENVTLVHLLAVLLATESALCEASSLSLSSLSEILSEKSSRTSSLCLCKAS